MRLAFGFALSAWIMFIVAFFLPSYTEAYGFQCAILQRAMWDSATSGNWAAIHYELLTLANGVMIVSPWVFSRFVRGAGSRRGFITMTSISAGLVAGFLGLFLFDGESRGDLRIGAFIWMSSFLALWIGSLLIPSAEPSP